MSETATKPAPAKAAKPAKPVKVSSRYEKEGTGAEAKFFRIRANGTKRHVPTLTGEALETAKAIKAQREQGVTMKAIAAERHLSLSSVRRMLTSLALTEEVQAVVTRTAKGRATKAAKASAPKASATA